MKTTCSSFLKTVENRNKRKRKEINKTRETQKERLERRETERNKVIYTKKECTYIYETS